MSFLSRRPSRSGNRGRDAVREDEYDDYDYAPDGYVRDARSEEDENWSANEYFSPDGIKGRWAAGHQPGETPAVRGNRDNGRGDRGDVARGDSGRGHGGYDDGGYNGHGPGGRDRQERARGAAEEYDAESHQGGGYPTDDYATGGYELPDGTDEERAERGGRRRKTRGEWGSRLGLRRDRGEDIWPDDGVSDEDYWASVAADRPLPPSFSPLEADPASAPTGADVGQPASDPRLGGDSRPVSDPRLGGEQRGGGTGRLGPAPGLVGDVSAPGRPATGPHAIRPSAGNVWAGQALAAATGGFAQPDIAQPSFSPNGRQQDRPDWGERTERIDRVNASGYPDPRPSSRGRSPSGSWMAVDRREPSRDGDREPSRNSGGWPAAGRNSAQAPARAAGDDDPLTSTAYSRAALADADGRSYRVAARRSEAQSKLTEETQTFTAPGQYPGDRYPSDQYQAGQRPNGPSHTGEHPTRRYPTGGTGEYGQYGGDQYSPDQYRGGQQRGDAQEPTARYPAYGSQPSGQQPGQPARQGQAGSGRQPGQSGPGQPGQGQPGPGQSVGNSGRVSLPGASGSSSGLTGQYQTQQPQQTRQPQQQPRPQSPQAQPQQAQQTRQSAQSALPAGGNPYETAVTGAYPYPGQAGYPARSAPTPGQPQAQAAPGSTGRDDRRRRQPPPDGYGTGGPDHVNQGSGGRGAGAGYGDPRDGRY
jgi:hypothetical protein